MKTYILHLCIDFVSIFNDVVPNRNFSIRNKIYVTMQE